MVKLSIIVPIYNTEKYIERCLSSLINQTLQDIEIICINDGSTDNSIKILSQMAQSDSRIRIIEQPNLKQGAARNNGMRHATGEYLGFVDSDDWVDLDYYEKLYDAAKKYNVDIALATNVRIGNNKTKIKKRLDIKKEEVYNNLQDKIDICHQWKNECPTNKIYRHQMIKSNAIEWPEGCYCEDKLFTIKAIYYADGIVTVPDVNYYYYRNPNSTVNTRREKHIKQLLIDKNQARLSVIEFLRSKKAEIRDKDFWAITKEIKIFDFPLITIKESLKTKRIYLFGLVHIFSGGIN